MPDRGQDGSQPNHAAKQPPDREQARFLAIGQALSPWGVRGEFHVRILTDFPERFHSLRTAYMGEEHRPYEVERVRVLPDRVLLKLAGIDSPEVAKGLGQQLIYVPVEEAMALGEGEYYWHQIIGLGVWTTGGEYLGEVVDILTTGSNDVYVVKGPRGEVLVPAIEDVVVAVEPEQGRMTIEPMEGML